MSGTVRVFAIVVFCAFLSHTSMAVQVDLSGHVYNGPWTTDTPLSGVTVILYGSNGLNYEGTTITGTVTDATGAYRLYVHSAPSYDYYNIIQANLSGYTSFDSMSAGGVEKSADWIQYTYLQLLGTTTGNNFWDIRPNHAPVAEAGGPYGGHTGEFITLDGSASYDIDPCDEIVAWEWDLDGDGQYDDAYNAVVQHKWPTPYAGSIRLRVTDSFGAVGTDSTTANIDAAPHTGGISGVKFDDRNGNGDRDLSGGVLEPGLPGWTIFLDADGDGQHDPAEPSTTTGAYGEYLFSDLAPGTYRVDEVLQSGWHQTHPMEGTEPAAWEVVVVAGTTTDWIDFGNQQDHTPPHCPAVFACDPSPADGAHNVNPIVLQWKVGQTAAYHDVFFGRSADHGSRTFAGRHTTAEYVIPYALIPGTTYYWRVDEVEADGTTIHPGEVWSFTVAQRLTRVLMVTSRAGGSVLTPGEGRFQIDHGTTLTINATPADAEHEFLMWSGTAVDSGKVENPNAAQTTVHIDADYTLEAVFAEPPEGPTLGFSLGEINADDPQDYYYRVSTNNRAEATFVERVAGIAPDPKGMVRIQVVADESARAKARFGKCYAQRALVRFQYLFESANASEIVVYLSDVPELLDHDDSLRAEHYVEIGRAPAPPQGRPGSFGSGRFGTFEAWAWVQRLDLSHGTWVELELVTAQTQATTPTPVRRSIRLASGGSDDSALFDGLSVQVHCSGYCLDLNFSKTADSQDILLVMASCGSTAELDRSGKGSRYCLDGVFSDDGYVDFFDVCSWDWALEDTSRVDCKSFCRVPLPLCDISPVATSNVSLFAKLSAGRLQMVGVDSWPTGLLILGKPQWTTSFDPLKSGLYLFDSNAAYRTDYVTAGLPAYCNIRVVRGLDGQVYLVNSEQGALRLSDGSVTQVVAPGEASYNSDPRHHRSAAVFIGMQGQGSSCFGRPILDAAFDAQGYAYVVPVVVQPAGREAYEAAAKLRLDNGKGPSWQIVQLYDGDPPATNDNQERNHLREIEVDRAGHVYLLNVHCRNESDILWEYSGDGTKLRRWDLVVKGRMINVPDALGLTVPADGQTMYLASGQHSGQDSNSTMVYGLSTETADVFVVRQITIKGMALVSSVTEDPTGILWVLGFNTVKLPPRPGMKEQFDHLPRLANIPPGAKVVQTQGIAGTNLALPTSIVCTTGAR